MKLFFECSIEICGTPVKVKFCKEDGKDDLIPGFYFELSHFLKSKDDADIYRSPNNYGKTMEDCIFTLNLYIQRFKDVDKVEVNPYFLIL